MLRLSMPWAFIKIQSKTDFGVVRTLFKCMWADAFYDKGTRQNMTIFNLMGKNGH